ncbi:MAG TPA: T9SS type A sorting domain-containing protein [Flavobacteriales bacterium]|nr:T9SS type A sorting domain-containing protein [Flavobacteriales bacterium]HNU55035.1 T9SS type A sorting domain-containing protein [Flavobacteriales bacterium]
MHRNPNLLLVVTLLSVYEVRAQSFAELDINEVRARFHSNGLLGPDLATGESAFQVPATTAVSPMYSSGLWIGGLDPGNNLRLAAHLFGDNGQRDFFPGPLTTDGSATILPEVSEEYDQVWSVYRTEIETHQAYFACLKDPECDVNIAFPGGYTMPASIATWPAEGLVDLGQAPYLAPFVDHDQDGTYDPGSGDHPCILGDQALYAIYNDKAGPHLESNSLPIGLEVHAMPFAYASVPGLEQTVFIQYLLINRSSNTLTELHIAHFADFDLGCSEDDHVGTDAARGLVYAVNGNAVDGDCMGTPGYGEQPPAFGMVVLKGPLLEPDGLDNAADPLELYQYGTGYADGIVDNERHGLDRSMYFMGAGPSPMLVPTPFEPSRFFNYMRGIWLDNSVLTYGGNGYGGPPDATASDYAFPGDTDPTGYGTNGEPQAPWTETSASNTPGDRKALAIMGPGTLEPGEHMTMLVAYVYARATSGGPQGSVSALQERVDSLRAVVEGIEGLFDQGETAGLACQSITTALPEVNGTSSITLFPNPAVDQFTLRCSAPSADALMELFDMRGARVMVTRLTGTATTIDVSHLRPGIYGVRVRTAGMASTFQLVKAE